MIKRPRPLVAISDDVKTIFEITRLHRLFEVCADTTTAIKRFGETK